jgi:hypothetical protein
MHMMRDSMFNATPELSNVFAGMSCTANCVDMRYFQWAVSRFSFTSSKVSPFPAASNLRAECKAQFTQCARCPDDALPLSFRRELAPCKCRGQQRAGTEEHCGWRNVG